MSSYISRTIGTGELKEVDFIDALFPTDISYGAVRLDLVTEISADSDEEYVKWDISHGVKTQAQLEALIAFFRKVKGSYCCFRLKDWTTNTVHTVRFDQSRLATCLDSYGSCRQFDKVIIVAVKLYELKEVPANHQPRE